MDIAQRRLIEDSVFRETGVIIHVDEARSNEIRSSVVAWIDGYTSQNGPRFLIKGHGLKKHLVIVEFGSFALPCIQLIQTASDNQYDIAREILKRVAKNNECNVTISPNQDLNNWKVLEVGFRIEVNAKVNSGQYENSTIIEVTKRFLVPLIIAISELIGYDIDESIMKYNDYEEEGDIRFTKIQKRERSNRNRQICLAIHGEVCAVCGFSADKYYFSIDNIIEVHHIEPLSTLEQPRKYDPKKDLIPLCPNCHAAIHKRTPPFLPDELKRLVKNAS
jgi:5-methylcytosine-specific restriction protein A